MKRRYIDNRDWKEYNEELVMRGYFYFNPEFLLSWNDELAKMNARKVGQPYLYPESMIKFLAVLHCKFDFRALEGFMHWLSEMNYTFHINQTYPHFHAIRRQIRLQYSCYFFSPFL